MKKLMLALACFMPLTVSADDHAPMPPAIAVVYECTLNEGVAAADLVAFGRSDVKTFVANNDLTINSYLWEAIAVNDPYRESDVRWVNYFPTWDDYWVNSAAFGSKGAPLVGKFNSMVTCEKEVILGAQNLMSDLVVADQKPFVASVCQLNDGKTMADAMTFSKKFIAMAGEVVNAEVGGTVFSPVLGISGFDYVATFYGETSEMTKLMNGVRDRSMPAAMMKAGMQPVADCVNDLHMSHMMVQQSQ